MVDLNYHCPETGRPIGTSVPSEALETPGAHIVMLEVDKCPCCGREHILGEEDLYADEGDD